MEIKHEFFKKLLDCKWLENCGNDKDVTYDFEVIQVKKEEALKRIVSLKWENTCLDAHNDLIGYLFTNHYDEYKCLWNKQVKILHAEYFPQIEEKIRKSILEKDLPEEVIPDIRINFIRIMMNHYFSEYYESQFLNKLLDIYLSGHLPCGFTGNHETGKIMIY